MLTVQQAVFTVESLISKVQQQKQLITHQQQVIEQLLKENKQLRKENEQLKYRVQELEARTKKNSSNSHLPPSSDRLSTPILLGLNGDDCSLPQSYASHFVRLIVRKFNKKDDILTDEERSW